MNTEILLLRGLIYLENGKDKEAVMAFRNVLETNSDFKSFEEINSLVKHLASEKCPSHLRLTTRKALLGLGIIYARKGNIREDYILDAAYACQDGGILFLAGTFYLALFDAELDTAFAYFQKACQIDPRWVWRCDESVQWFMMNRMVFYLFSGIMPYKELWDKIKNEITRQLTDTVTIKDSFVDRLLDILKDFGKKETKHFADFLKLEGGINMAETGIKIETKYSAKTDGETLTISLGKNCVVFSTENLREYEGRKWIETMKCTVPSHNFERLMEKLRTSGGGLYEEPIFAKDLPDKERAKYDLAYILSYEAKEMGIVDIKRLDDETVEIQLNKIVNDGFYGPNGGSGHSHWEFGAQKHKVPYGVLEDLWKNLFCCW